MSHDERRGPAKNPAARKLISSRKGTTTPRQRSNRPSALVWHCDACSRPIADHDGWITISYAEIGAFRQSEAAWEKKHCTDPDGFNVHTFADLLELPELVVWHVWHRGCDPDIDSSDYCIDVDRIRTYAQLLEWTCHLLDSKTWLVHTTWSSILRTQATRLGRAA